MPINGQPKGRFELPQITPVVYSLTDGTDIPPPPDSPISDSPPPVAKSEAPGQSQPQNGGILIGTPQKDVTGLSSPPMSPASSTRPSSIRRFLSRKSLNANYINGTNTNANGSQEDLGGRSPRPDSRLSFSSTAGSPSLMKKRSASWFRFGRSKRTSVVMEEKMNGNGTGDVLTDGRGREGPPPPMLPELDQLKAKMPDNTEGSLGGDELFRDIK